MTKTNEQIMESLEDCRTRLLEIEVLRQELYELLNDAFPLQEENGYDCMDIAMAFFHFGIQDKLYTALLEYCFIVDFGHRSITEFFKGIGCPYDLAHKEHIRKDEE